MNIKLNELLAKANENDSIAQYDLGIVHVTGNIKSAHKYILDDEIDKNIQEGVKWLTRSSDNLYPYAKFTLGRLYTRGEGVVQNFDKAFDLLLGACVLKHTKSYYYLAVLYIQGYDSKIMQEERGVHILQWLLKAALLGDFDAQSLLGMICIGGGGGFAPILDKILPVNPISGLMWLNVALANPQRVDVNRLMEARDSIAKKMSPEDINKSQQKAINFRNMSHEEIKTLNGESLQNKFQDLILER